MSIRILVMGLPGAGKTTLADAVASLIPCSLRLNADKLRHIHNDWDFSYTGRLRQANRMRRYAELSEDPVVIADFVCPLPEMRQVFAADVVVWVDTIPTGRYGDTNKIFVPPDSADVRVTSYDTSHWSSVILARVQELNELRQSV